VDIVNTKNKVLHISNFAICFVLSIIGICGLNYILSLASDTVFSNSVLSIPVFGFIFFLEYRMLNKFKSEPDRALVKRTCIYAFILAFLFSLSMVLGWQIKANGMTESGFLGKGKILVAAVAFSAALMPVAYAFFSLLSLHQGKAVLFKITDTRKLFLIFWLVIFVCWVPVFLAYYPAVMAYDFNIQSLQASWGPPYFSSHHPIAHTLLIWVFFQVGKMFGSLQTGMAFYSIFQMLLLAAALAYAVTFIYRISRQKWVSVAALLFFGVFPYNSILSVSVTKDVIFAALFLVFMLLILERILFPEKQSSKKLNILTFLDGFAMLLFRNNAIYAFVAFAVIYVIASKGKERLRVFVLCAVIAVSGKLALEALVTYCGYFGKGSAVEMYSVPIQQFARVGYYHGYLHGNQLDSETYDTIDKYVAANVWEAYNPPIADTVKIQVAAYRFGDWKDDMAAMWKDWAKVGMKYPNEYIDAFLCLTNGYWFLDDVTWAENLGYGLESRKGALFTFNASVSEAQPDGIPNESKLPALERVLEEIVSNNCFYKLPVVSNLFKPAFYCWTMFICALGFMYQRRKNMLLLTVFPFMYLGTLLLGPVVIVRYLFPIIVFVPVLVTLLIYNKNVQ
jgi:hypothetical protein